MTKQSTFKAKIRARMEKTGERYAAARLALLRQAPARHAQRGIGALPGYAFRPLVEHDTGLLSSAMAQSGVVDPGSGEHFSAERLFGLSGGIGFMYFVFEYEGHAPMLTITCRSWSMPGPVVDRALEAAGVQPERTETSGAAAARRFLDGAIDAGRCVHATLDVASLPWWGMPTAWTGQMPRQANVVGRADEGYLVDLGGPVTIDEATLARARVAPRKEKHRALAFLPGPAGSRPADATRAAVHGTAARYVHAPFKGFASNFGLAGIEKAARLCADLKDPKGWPRLFDSGPLAFLALTRTWECLTLELTPPAGGRGYYADFLATAARDDALGMDARRALAEAADLARRSAERFAALADDLLDMGGKAVARGAAILEETDEARRGGEPDAAARIAALSRERSELGDGYALPAETRRETYGEIGQAFAEIHGIEAELRGALASV